MANVPLRLARSDAHSHTHPAGFEAGSQGKLNLSAAQMRLHISKMWEHHSEFQMGADEAKKLRKAADSCRPGAEAFQGAEGGSGKAPQGMWC